MNWKRVYRWRWAAYVLVLLVALQVMGLGFLGWRIVRPLLFGWYAFVRDVVLEARVYWPSVATGAVCLAVLAVGVHMVARWLCAASASSAGDTSSAKWRFRRSLAVLALVVIAFVAGIAMVSIVHQGLWLTRDLAADQALRLERGWGW